MTDGLFALLRNRMTDEAVGLEEPVAVAELHKRLLPYHTCRDRLGYATKAEYDAAVLELLADDRLVMVEEPALREAVRSEIRQPEPGLAFLQRFAASEIRLRDVGPAEPITPIGDAESPPAETGTPVANAAAQCRACRLALPDVEGIRFCPSCGADQAVPMCTSCGAELETGWRYCAYCGSIQKAPTD